MINDARDLEVGDRVRGIRSQKGKTGTVVKKSTGSISVRLRWDGGKRASDVDVANLERDEDEEEDEVYKPLGIANHRSPFGPWS